MKISTHTSRVGCDFPFLSYSRTVKFLLTHPVWDVTDLYDFLYACNDISTHTSRVGCDIGSKLDTDGKYDFYSHIPCGMWLMADIDVVSHVDISTHTSRVGCDGWIKKWMSLQEISTHTSRVGCDYSTGRHRKNRRISTHTSRVGCDLFVLISASLQEYFYSHIPCGMWRCRYLRYYRWCYGVFLLTHPVWDVTLDSNYFLKLLTISTHTSRVGCDVC